MQLQCVVTSRDVVMLQAGAAAGESAQRADATAVRGEREAARDCVTAAADLGARRRQSSAAQRHGSAQGSIQHEHVTAAEQRRHAQQ